MVNWPSPAHPTSLNTSQPAIIRYLPLPPGNLTEKPKTPLSVRVEINQRAKTVLTLLIFGAFILYCCFLYMGDLRDKLLELEDMMMEVERRRRKRERKYARMLMRSLD